MADNSQVTIPQRAQLSETLAASSKNCQMKHRTNFEANRLREVLLNGTFIANTNFKDQITKVSWQDSIKKFYNLNTIAVLTFHINYYLAGLIGAFRTGKLEIRDIYSFDMLPIKSEADWMNLVETFLTNAEEFCLEIESLPSERLDEIFIDPKYGSFLRNIEAMIEHSYYHLGQIVLIRKLINHT